MSCGIRIATSCERHLVLLAAHRRVLTAVLALTATSSWPSLVAVSFLAHALAHAQNGVPVAAWPIQFLANATQALLAAFLLRRHTVGANPFSSLRHSVLFVVGAGLVAPAVASLIPAYVYVRQGWAPDFSDAWLARFISNAVATLTLVPALMIGWQCVSTRPVRTPRRGVEFGLLLLAVLVCHAFAGSVPPTDELGWSVALSVFVPILLWATIRFEGAGLSVALLWTILLTLHTAMTSLDTLARGAATERMIALQLFAVATATPMMLIAGSLAQYRTAHAALTEAEHQKTAILNAHPDFIFLQTVEGLYLQVYARIQPTYLYRLNRLSARTCDRYYRQNWPTGLLQRSIG